jgi:hypothetical protein
MLSEAGRQLDPLILPYLHEKDEASARRLLDEIVTQQADPIIKGVIARQKRSESGRRVTGRRPETEEIQGEIVLQLVARLEALRASDSERAAAPIADLRDYVSSLASESCQSWLRRSFPRRARIRNHLRYLLSHDARFLMRPSASDGWLCGLSDRDVRSLREGDAASAPGEAPAETPRGGRLAGPAASASDPSPAELADLARDLLQRAGRPLDLEFLVDAVARAWGVEEPAEATGPDDAGRERPSAAAPPEQAAPEAPGDSRALLKRTWDRILQLPPLQRSVLLLGLSDPLGHGLIGLFPVTGVAGIRRMAIALGLRPERFAEQWKDLPLDDEAIAVRLRVSRAQVSELRRSALERLARRKD